MCYQHFSGQFEIVCVGMTCHSVYMRANLHTEADSGSQNGSCGENKEKQERKRQTDNAHC